MRDYSDNYFSTIENQDSLFLKIIISVLGKKPKIKFKGLQTGDVKKTHASNINLGKKTGFNSKTNLKQGIKKFIDWYLQYKKN